MKRLLPLFAIFLLGAAPSRTCTYTTGQVISPSCVSENEDNVFSYLQGGVDTLKASSVTSSAITDGTIAAADIGSGAVTSASILDSTIATGDISTGGVTTTNVLDGSLTTTDFNASVTTAFLPVTKIVPFTRSAVAGSGAQAVTGMGFAPVGLWIVCNDAVNGQRGSIGFGDDDGLEYNLFLAGNAFDFDSTEIITLHSTGDMDAVLTSLDSDGFTVTWTIGGAGLDAECGAMGLR